MVNAACEFEPKDLTVLVVAALCLGAPIGYGIRASISQARRTGHGRMARDRAAVERGIEQLKANQEQMARDNAKIADQLKANQEQTARDNAMIAKQLTASQEQMAAVIANTSKQILRSRRS